jgi:predicted transcriptional regulator
MSTTELTAAIVASYVERNRLAPSELEALIRSVYGALTALGQEAPASAPPEKVTAAQVKRSIQPDALISFLDGRPYKLLKRHLNTHGLTPEDYRARFGLPKDYPMTAPGYAAKRSEFAKASGLGVSTRRRR